MILSILIRTIVGREVRFQRLIDSLLVQGVFIEMPGGWIDEANGVEILFEKDNKEISVGAKAQKLLERASGYLVSFIDDDDRVADDYIPSIVHAVVDIPTLDCIGFKIECHGTSRNGKPEMASASNKWDYWADNTGGFRYVRTIYHKSPVRRDIALSIGYKDIRFGEDHDYSLRLKQSGLIKNETYLDKVMYHYQYEFQDPKVKYGM